MPQDTTEAAGMLNLRSRPISPPPAGSREATNCEACWGKRWATRSFQVDGTRHVFSAIHSVQSTASLKYWDPSGSPSSITQAKRRGTLLHVDGMTYNLDKGPLTKLVACPELNTG
ncbi:hypothetical protein FQN57_005100 [Myotisia sp. PD_48]|nr:hypothetical protein FQN57_005100 [Myotisia sp. PD_48]